ncbi:MAG TPA: polysaccharide biosynthesis C-terminal domain-containing protein [Stellaceae bacterium]|nr:polysaccharide biosynthesis C-terminal domain-containing protein [Stellaceae bacterium]
MLAKYGSIQLLGRFLPGLIGFVVAAGLTRLLPPAQYGTYGLAWGLSQLFALAVFGWLGLSITRLATGRSVDARFANSVFAVFAVLAAVAGLAGGLSFLLPVAHHVPAMALAVAAGSIVLAYLDVTSSFLTAALDFRGFLTLNVTRAATSAAVVFGAAYCFHEGLAVFAVSLIATLSVCLWFPRRVRISVATGVDRQVVARLIGFGMPIAASLTLFALSAWSDRLVLSVEAGIEAVGFYTAATVVVQNSLLMVAQAIGSAAYPLAVLAYDSGNRLVSNRQLEQNFIALVGVLVPGAVGLSLLAPNIVTILVGPSYREAVIHLTPILASAAVISGIRSNFVDHAFQLTGSTWHYFWIAAGMAAVNLVALILLVPRYGYIGAGAAVAVTEFCGLGHALLAAHRVYRLPFPRREAAKVATAVLMMAGALVPFAHFGGGVALLGQVSLGLAVYAVALWSLNLLNLRETTMNTVQRWLTAR